MTLSEHLKNNLWPYAAITGVIGAATIQSRKWYDKDYAADAYDMNLHVWLCGRCHHVYDENEEAEECCSDDRQADYYNAELFTETDAIKVTVKNRDGFYATDGEVIVSYTTAAQEGFEEKQLKPVIWVWSDEERNGAYLDTKDISFATESFASAMIMSAKPKGVVEKALRINFMMRKMMFNDTMSYLKQELNNGRITPKKYALAILDLEQQLSSEQDITDSAVCPCQCGGIVSEHDDRSYGLWPCPSCQNDSDQDLGKQCSDCKSNAVNSNQMTNVVIKPNRVEKQAAEASVTRTLKFDPLNEDNMGVKTIKRVGRHRVGGKIVEDCVDIQSSKVDATRNYYRVRFRAPSDFSNFRVPVWASRAAHTIGLKYFDVSGSKITMGQTRAGDWAVQSIIIPKISRLTPAGALKIANHIQDRIEREGRWARKDCLDKEQILVVM